MKRTLLIWTGGIVVFLVAAAIIFIGLLPTLLSTDFGKQQLIRVIDQNTKSRTTIQSLSLSWFGPQKINGLAYASANNQFSCRTIGTPASLWKILVSQDAGSLEFTSPQLVHAFVAPSSETLKTAEQYPGWKKKKNTRELPFKGKIIVKDGRIRFSSQQAGPLAFEHLNFTFSSAPKFNNTIEMAGSGSAVQDTKTGSFHFQGHLEKAFSSFPSGNFEAKMTDLPIQGLDNLVSLSMPHFRGVLTALLGPSLNLEITSVLSPRVFDVHLEALSDQFSAHLETQTSEKGVTLQAPGFFSLKAPLSAFPFFKDKLANLTNPSFKLGLTIEQLDIPISNGILDFSRSAFKSLFKAEPAANSGFSASGFAKSDQIDKGIEINLDGSGKFDQFTPVVSLSGKIDQIFSAPILSEGSIRVNQIPLALLAQKKEQQTWTDVFGDQLDAELSLKTIDRQSHLEMQATTPKLKTGTISFTKKIVYQLDSPFNVVYALSNQTVNWLSVFFQTPFEASTPLNISVTDATLPASFDLSAMTLKADFSVNSAVSHLNCNLDVNSWDSIKLNVRDSAPFQFEMQAAIKDKVLIVKKPISLEALFYPRVFAMFVPNHYKAILLAPAVVRVNLEPFSLPLVSSSLRELKFKGNASSEEILIGLQAQAKKLNVEKVSLDFQANGKQKSAEAALSCLLSQEGLPGAAINTQMQVEGFQIVQNTISTSLASCKISCLLKQMDASLVELCFPKLHRLSAVTGQFFDFTFNANGSRSSQKIAVDAQSPSMKLTFGCSLNNKFLKLEGKEAIFSTTLSPEGYLFLDQLLNGPSSYFQLNEPSRINISLQRLNIPVQYKNETASLINRLPSLKFDFARLQVQGNMGIDKCSFQDTKLTQAVLIRGLSVKVSKPTIEGPGTFTIDGQTTSKQSKSIQSASKDGHIQLAGNFDHLLTADGHFDPNKGFKVDGTLQQFPSISLDFAARFFGTASMPFSSVFGDMVNSTIAIDIQGSNGPIKLYLNSPNTRLSFAGKLNNGMLMPDDPVHAQVQLSPPFSQFLLKHGHLPFTAISAQNPFTLEIKPEGVQIPVSPFEFDGLNIPNARIELGRVVCENQGNVNSTLNLLKSRQLSKQKQLNLWFAPLDFHIKDGIVDCERTEFLLGDAFDLCIWGKIELAKQYVNMVLGLTADSIRRAFGITQLPANYVLQIPVKGNWDDLQINSGKATAKIAALLAWQKGQQIGGKGAIIGEVLRGIATLPDMSNKPPAAKHPFPWELESSSSEEEPLHKKALKKKAIKKGDKPLKQLLKLLR